MDSEFPASRSDQASEECAGQANLIHGGITSQLTGLRGSIAKVLVPDTTAHQNLKVLWSPCLEGREYFVL